MAGTTLACMSTAFVLVGHHHHQTLDPFEKGQGVYWLSGEARSLACVCERKGKESKDILCFGIVVHQPAWYKRSFGVFNKG